MARPKRQAPWLDTRDNGKFYAFWYDDVARETKRLSLRTTDRDEAQARFARFLIDGREIRQQRPAGALRVARALDDYFDEHVKKHCAAPRRQEDAIRNLKAFFDDRPLGDVDVPLSQDYAEARFAGLIGGGKRRKDKTASPATVRRELNVLVAAANHARWMKRTKEIVAVDMPPERRLGPDDEAPYYSKEELDAIFAAAEADGGEIEMFVKLLYYTGARRKSIENLTRERVRVAQKRIILQEPGKRTTKKRQPIVPILKSMESVVDRLLEVGGKRRLFVRADFYRPYRDLVSSITVGHNKQPIEEGRRHPHIMRHTRATHLLQDGKSLYDVAKLLGDTVATVERVYGHHSADHLASRLED